MNKFSNAFFFLAAFVLVLGIVAVTDTALIAAKGITTPLVAFFGCVAIAVYYFSWGIRFRRDEQEELNLGA